MNFENISPRDAIALQKELRERVVLQPLDTPPQTIAGVDISFNRFSDVVYAGIVVRRTVSAVFPTLQERLAV
jgi:deoxyribonuclease V